MGHKAMWAGVPDDGVGHMGVGFLLSDRLVQCMIDEGCVSPRLLWLRLKIGLVRVFVLGVYAPDMSKPAVEREEFWDQVRDVLKTCGQNERIILVGDFNGWVGVRRDGLEGILGKYGDVRTNGNGDSLLEVCLEWSLSVTNTMFCHREIHMYTWERAGSRSMIDFVVVDERLAGKVADTRVYRGTNVGTDHYLVVSRIKGLFRHWRHRAQVPATRLERIRVERLQDDETKEKYYNKVQERFRSEYDEYEEDISDIDSFARNLSEGMVEIATEVCGVSKRKDGRKDDKEWWDEEVSEVTKEKRKAWLDWLAARANHRMNDTVRTKDAVVSARCMYDETKERTRNVVKRKKKEWEEKCERRLSGHFRTNAKLFWKMVRVARGKSESGQLGMVWDKNGQKLEGESEMLDRWREYFEGLFEGEEVSPRDLSEVGIEEIPLSHDMERESEIGMEELLNALKSMKAGKSAGYDRVSTEMLRAGRGIIAKLLLRLFNACWREGRAPSDWCKAIIVPLFKGKRAKQDCKNYRGISLLSVVGKLYAKILIERVVKETSDKIWDVQAGFRKGMGCSDQVFSLRCIAEKFLARGQKVFSAFIDLEKAYDRVVRDDLWSTLSMYGLNSSLIRALKSLYENSSACVRVNGAYTDWFGIHRGVRQGCVASPWLFNLFMDSCLYDLKECDRGLRMGELLIKCLLYADDQVLLASSADELQEMVTLVNEALERKGMKVNVSKTKIMVFEREESVTECQISIGDERVEQVKEFVYLGSMFTRDGKCVEDIERRVKAGNKVNGALHAVVSSKNMSMQSRIAVHQSVLVPSLSYGSESWVWQKRNESRVNAVEMRSLRSMIGVTLNDRIRNVEIRKRCGLKEDVVTKIEKSMLRWFGHLERMDEQRMTKAIYRANVSGRVSRGRPRRTYLDQIGDVLQKGRVVSTRNRRACMRRLMNVDEAKVVCRDRASWRSVVSAYPSGDRREL